MTFIHIHLTYKNADSWRTDKLTHLSPTIWYLIKIDAFLWFIVFSD